MIAQQPSVPGDVIHRPTFRPSLLQGLRYVSSLLVAELLWAIVQDEAVLEELEAGVTAAELVERVGGPDPQVAAALLDALRFEGVLEQRGGRYRLAAELSELRSIRGWFELLIGGYRPLFQQVGTLLRQGRGSVPRNDLHVARGSADIGRFDSVPMTLRIMERLGGGAGLVLDYGCGNGFSLVTLCQSGPALRAVGVEVAAGSVQAARRLVAEAGLSDRIDIMLATQPGFFPELQPDFVVIAFVLHEIAGAAGIDGCVDFLRELGRRYPQAALVVVEVADPRLDGRQQLLMTDPQGRHYYNHYLWIHSVTQQQLLTREQWSGLFDRAGYRVVCEEEVDPVVDPTGLEFGVGLRRALAGFPAGDSRRGGGA